VVFLARGALHVAAPRVTRLLERLGVHVPADQPVTAVVARTELAGGVAGLGAALVVAASTGTAGVVVPAQGPIRPAAEDTGPTFADGAGAAVGIAVARAARAIAEARAEEADVSAALSVPQAEVLGPAAVRDGRRHRSIVLRAATALAAEDKTEDQEPDHPAQPSTSREILTLIPA